MKEDLKERIALLHEDLQYMEWLAFMKDEEGGEKDSAETYILQESPFWEWEPEN